jgi:DNA-directed RNA polymerase subunit M/transcription elongation factor TFIIS
MSPDAPSAPAESSATASAAESAGGPSRYRCSACGNLTRFDVVTSRRTKAFHHYSVGGELTIEEVDVLQESVEEVSCRWCGNGKAIEVLERGGPEPA